MIPYVVIGIVFSAFTVGVSYFFKKNFPKEINSFIGYRTWRSMQSPEMWTLANQYASLLLFKLSFATLPVFLLFLFTFTPHIAFIIAVVYWILGLILTLVKTEIRLKRIMNEPPKG